MHPNVDVRSEQHAADSDHHLEFCLTLDAMRADIRCAIAEWERWIIFRLRLLTVGFVLIGGGLMGMMAAILAKL